MSSILPFSGEIRLPDDELEKWKTGYYERQRLKSLWENPPPVWSHRLAEGLDQSRDLSKSVQRY